MRPPKATVGNAAAGAGLRKLRIGGGTAQLVDIGERMAAAGVGGSGNGAALAF